MLKIFRRIRQKLISKNSFRKYLVYAIGEIVLVVIGILIALQINNLNEDKKDRNFEIKMLSEIERTLETDKDYIQKMLKRLEKLDSTSNYFMELSKRNVLYHDSIFFKIFSLNRGISYYINSGPYQAVKSVGIDKISNDSLRNKLINFYDFDLPRYEDNFKHTNRNYREDIETLLKLLGDRYINNNNDINFIAYKNIPLNIFQQQEFLEILSNINWRSGSSKQIYKTTFEELENLIQEVKQEIKHD
ncbi:DUF6090 family protein [Hyunsoonleella aestuarii]|uniref:Uncharacterized protein n=1 Tax=Hyunsoonleella aestuarii TaxID=912802 RepID=A0ABP8EAC1_9FLAO|nr:DUF6090 family protein [Hyunsoonleella aestuarii]